MRGSASPFSPMDGPEDERPRDLLVSGHVNIDRFLRVDRFPEPDRTVPVRGSRAELGGTAANIARVAASYGVACGLLARVGDGWRAEYAHLLEASRIDVRGLELVDRISTPTCYIVEDGRGRQRTLIDQGAMGDRVPPYRAPSWFREYRWVHLTTGPVDRQLAVAREAHRNGLRVAADPAQEIFYRWDPPSFRRLLRESELLFGNRDELARGQALVGGRTIADLLERVPTIVRTEGGRGATAFTRAGTYHVPSRRPRRVRTAVGAGDAFRGGFYAAWFEGEPMPGCLTAGTRAAVAWIEGAR